MYICKECGKEFETRQSLGGHVVSTHKKEKLGSVLNKKRNEEEYLKNPKLCECCGKIISYEKIRREKNTKFCSSSCSATINNKKRIKQKKFCLHCNKELSSKRKENGNKFCNMSCSVEYKKKHYIQSWLSNHKLPIMDGGKPNETVREYLLTEQKNKCAICGMENFWNGKLLIFVLDHIDGNSSNSSKENLRLICHNCDSQTNTYKARNKGKGRFFRKQRMLEGKSY